MSRQSRREFLQQLVFRPKKEGLTNDVLVTVFLRGGADTLNMLIPYADDQYYLTRPTVSIAAPGKAKKGEEASLKIDALYSMHPRMAPLMPLFNSGKLAFIQGVGSDNPSGSHFEAQDQMEHGLAYGEKLGGGWLGRFLQTSGSKEHHSPLCAVCIGPAVNESLRGAPSASALRTVEDIRLRTTEREEFEVTRALSQLYGADATMLSRSGLDTLDLLHNLRTIRSSKYLPAAAANYPKGQFADGLREVARLIKAKVGLRIACLDLGGWDTHFFQGSAEGVQAENIDALSKGLAAFQADLSNCPTRVCTLVMTEFGRRTYENSSLGTDHGKAFAMIVMGSHIHGGTIYGSFSGLKQQEQDILGPSGLGVAIDYRSVFSEVLLSMTRGNSRSVFPNFQSEPIGFMPGRSS
jgi:uncharacterized protein (DUF1501 family)